MNPQSEKILPIIQTVVNK